MTDESYPVIPARLSEAIVPITFANFEPIVDEDAGVTYCAWTNGSAIGYEVQFPDGRIEFIYLNPSTGGGGDPEHTPNVFVYQGPDGDPNADAPLHYYDVQEA